MTLMEKKTTHENSHLVSDKRRCRCVLYRYKYIPIQFNNSWIEEEKKTKTFALKSQLFSQSFSLTSQKKKKTISN